MKCIVCEKGLTDGVSLYRQNEKGQPGIWACLEHNLKKQDEEVLEIVKLVEEKKG